MKITGVTAFSTTPAGGRSVYVFVKVATDEGIVGWGESSIGTHSVAAVVEEFGQSIVGRDPFRIEEHWPRSAASRSRSGTSRARR